MADRFDVQLDRLWDDLATGQPVNATQDDAQLLGAIHSLHAANPPGSARERARHRIFELEPISGEDVMPVSAAALPLAPTNGRSSPAHVKPVPIQRPAAVSTRWRWISIAAALLILLAGLSGWLAYERVGDNTPESPAVIPAIQATPTGDWPMYRGNPARTGSTLGHGIIGQPQVAWTFKTDGSAYRSPAVVAGIAYLGSADGNLYALDVDTGAEQWRFQGDSAMESTPTVADGTVYITSDNGTFYAIDAETGELRWQFEQAIIQNYSAIAFDTTIVVGNDNAEVIGLDTATGEQRWAITLGSPIMRTPGADGGTFYAASADGKLYALNATGGSTIWTFDTGDPDVGTPSIVNGTVYFTHHAGKIVSVLDAATGEELSQFDAPSPDIGMAPPTIADDGFYVASGDMHYYKLDRTDGSVVWSFPLAAESYACPVVADGIMYASGNDGLLHALDAETGEELWTVPLDGAVSFGPSLAGGMLYVSTDTGTLYAIEGMGEAPHRRLRPLIRLRLRFPKWLSCSGRVIRARSASIPLVWSSSPMAIWRLSRPRTPTSPWSLPMASCSKPGAKREPATDNSRLRRPSRSTPAGTPMSPSTSATASRSSRPIVPSSPHGGAPALAMVSSRT
jgi:outer membrane protein assembly factor BamB